MTPSPSPFAPTHWTLVLRARGESEDARQALSELCEAYWTPVFRFLRAEGRTEDVARELTQEFFSRILGGSGFDGADPGRGRFRSYLLGALKHFLADSRDRELRQKRGAQHEHIPLEPTDHDNSDAALQVPDPSAILPEAAFDREWALTLMDRTLKSLQHELASAGKAAHFDALKTWLGGTCPTLSQADIARQLEITEGAVKVAIHRLRQRFRFLIRAELAQTVDRSEDLDDELRYLVEVLGHTPVD